MLNIVLDSSKNYAQVQSTILDTITEHLPDGSWKAMVKERDTEALNFSLFVRQPADVVMSHGLADKNYFTDTWDDDGLLFVNRLSHLLVSGPWLKEKLLTAKGFALGEDQIHTVGWPRLDVLRGLEPAPRESDRPRVLWAPTHDFRKRGPEERSTSSYPEFEEFLPALGEHAEVSVSLHPRNRPTKEPTDQALVDADLVVSDFGTLVYEAWALGKPVIFPRWILGDRIQEYLPGSAEAVVFEQRLGYHPDSFEALLAVVAGEPVVSPEVDAFMTGFVDNYRSGSSGARVAELLLELDRRRS